MKKKSKDEVNFTMPKGVFPMFDENGNWNSPKHGWAVIFKTREGARNASYWGKRYEKKSVIKGPHKV